MKRIKPPIPISAGVMLSYQCNAECLHCMYACTPRWKGWISEKDLEDLLSKLAGKIMPSPFGAERVSLNYGLHFTGGEPFINFPLLLKAVEIADELKIPSTFVETNCYWCKDDKITREKLELLKFKGLKGIMISVNPFYLEFVPFERTERAIRIAQEVFPGNVMIYQLEYYYLFKRMGIKGKMRLGDYRRLARDELAGRVELLLMGRAVYKLSEFYPKYPARFFFHQPCQPPFIRNWHNHFDNYGNFLPGYCGGISLGDWRNLDELLRDGIDLSSRPILNFLVSQDFEGLFNFAREYGYEEIKDGYISKCHLCLDIRKFLLDKGEFEELRPREFYSYL